jgi:hypothetical protein
MISVLSLVVAILAVFVGPLVTRANVQRQIQVAAREAWMREFREQVAGFLGDFAAYREAVHWLASKPTITWEEGRKEEDEKRLKANDAMRRHYHVIRLLVGERGQHAEFIQILGRPLQVPLDDRALEPAEAITSAAAAILQHERAIIEADQGMWHEWQPWSRFVAWCRRLGTPPRFPGP